MSFKFIATIASNTFKVEIVENAQSYVPLFSNPLTYGGMHTINDQRHKREGHYKACTHHAVSSMYCTRIIMFPGR